MSAGLFALLDDVAGIAKVAASSLDDVVAHAARTGAKSAGVVIDDAAVTPRYVVGFASERELPIIGQIARGSLRNKLLILLPAALALAILAPWLITPLLMLGGAFLCYEGAEKVYEMLFPHPAHEHESKLAPESTSPEALEKAKVAGAIRTDLILSAEIMAISLASLPGDLDFWMKALVLALVAIAITVVVYGSVAIIVKADDVGVALAGKTSDSPLGALARLVGKVLVQAMPVFLAILSLVGTAAMIWVGGGILLHGLEEVGFGAPAHLIHHWAEGVSHAVAGVGGFAGWLVTATCSGVFGLVVGIALIPFVGRVVAPVAKRLGRRKDK